MWTKIIILICVCWMWQCGIISTIFSKHQNARKLFILIYQESYSNKQMPELFIFEFFSEYENRRWFAHQNGWQLSIYNIRIQNISNKHSKWEVTSLYVLCLPNISRVLTHDAFNKCSKSCSIVIIIIIIIISN